jgi:hypothetical protein
VVVDRGRQSARVNLYVKSTIILSRLVYKWLMWVRPTGLSGGLDGIGEKKWGARERRMRSHAGS